MGKINVKGGTPVGTVSMCRTCSWAHIMTGYRESEMVVVCTNLSPNIAVPFTVRECSGYNDKNRPNWDQMKRLAIDVLPIRSGKRSGFAAPEQQRPGENVNRN
ncbi:MAG TPA: hypothetical protein VFW25_02025 [Silvibacterium sp.]|nr:hypothetical protein [Silvibacterium sp.]